MSDRHVLTAAWAGLVLLVIGIVASEVVDSTLWALKGDPMASGPVAGLEETARHENGQSSGWPLDMPQGASVTRRFGVESLADCRAAYPTAVEEAESAGWELHHDIAGESAGLERWIDGAGNVRLYVSCDEDPYDSAYDVELRVSLNA